MTTMYAYGAGVPRSYVSPEFPSLYWPIRAQPGQARYLYYLSDIYRYTLYWSLITIVSAHICVASWAVLMQFSSASQRRKFLASPAGKNLSAKNRRLLGENPIGETLGWVWMIPVVYVVMGGLEALLAGTMVGLVLGAVYNGGYFAMSTWTPLLWGIINMLVLVQPAVKVVTDPICLHQSIDAAQQLKTLHYEVCNVSRREPIVDEKESRVYLSSDWKRHEAARGRGSRSVEHTLYQTRMGRDFQNNGSTHARR
ncbi:hypothetical protein LTR96_007246 [Exophiala xenobiotica]|nr:hypothetical protein LTR96_007246 [Exophiala xenobiotica]KAK5334952.1 hypothetical protein LTR98_008672 [Exophiala xenobiotica]